MPFHSNWTPVTQATTLPYVPILQKHIRHTCLSFPRSFSLIITVQTQFDNMDMCVYLSVYLSLLSICMSVLSVVLSVRLCVSLSVLSISLSVYRFVCLFSCLASWLAGWLAGCWCAYFFICLSIFLSVCLSLSVYLSVFCFGLWTKRGWWRCREGLIQLQLAAHDCS